MNKTLDKNTKETIEKSTGFLSWIQEFSKKIVAVTFIIFVLVNVFVMVMIVVQYVMSGGEVTYLDTLITEVHNTFRDVIGGYIIKAATENVLKIGGSIVDKFLENQILSKQMDLDNNCEEDEEVEDEQ